MGMKISPMPFVGYRGLLLGLFFDEQLCNLDGVGGGAFSYLVAAAPQGDAVGVGEVGANPADEHRVQIGRAHV